LPVGPSRAEQEATCKQFSLDNRPTLATTIEEPIVEDRAKLISTCQLSFKQLNDMRRPPCSSNEGGSSSEIESGRRFYSKPSSFRSKANVFKRDLFEDKAAAAEEHKNSP
jgi:hypothetical protein